MIPFPTFTIERPAPLADTPSAIRMHNRIGKAALREELDKHWKKRLPGHFRSTNRAKYHHKERTAGYKRQKYRRFRSMTDLVKTGRTMRALSTNVKIVIGGTASGATGMVGKIVFRLPFPESQNENRSGVTGEQMKREIAFITPEEQREIAAGYAATYARMVNAELKNSPRRRKRLGIT